MSGPKMHPDELETDVHLAGQLVAGQFPHWAGLPIEPVPSAGTVNALYRLGDDMVVRLPRIAGWEDVDRQHELLPRLAPHLPVAIPVPLAKGEATEGYPWQWSVYRWLDGETLTVDPVTDLAIAEDMVEFLSALRRIDPTDGPPARRGVHASIEDEPVREAINALDGLVDMDAATQSWAESLRATDWDGPPVWVHGDLVPSNMLVRDGRLSAVIDFGEAGVGDPACDLIAAWSMMTADTRHALRDELQIDEPTWLRGRGWALAVALVAIPYYSDTNPEFVAVAKRMLDELLAEVAS